MSDRRLRSKECAYCGGRSTTRDHVPPAAFFPRPRPDNLITVPACDGCNNSLSADEEYLVNVLMSHHRAIGPAAEALQRSRFSRERTPRRVRMADTILSEVDSVDLLTEDGRNLGSRPRLTFRRARLEPVLGKIFRGLFFHEFGLRPAVECSTRSHLDPDDRIIQHPFTQTVFQNGTGRMVGHNQFEYRLLRPSDNPRVGVCAMLFFGRVLVLSTLLSQPSSAKGGAA